MLNSGKLLQRFFKNARYTDNEWDQLAVDILSDKPKSWICDTYNIKSSYYKEIKKYVQENGSF
jgi:spore coat polysaccharide biosynthesis predicted glycosyltransferase SpsG